MKPYFKLPPGVMSRHEKRKCVSFPAEYGSKKGTKRPHRTPRNHSCPWVDHYPHLLDIPGLQPVPEFMHICLQGGNLQLWDLGYPPSQDSSHHKDYEPFLVGNPYKSSFATVTGKGDNPIFILLFTGLKAFEL